MRLFLAILSIAATAACTVTNTERHVPAPEGPPAAEPAPGDEPPAEKTPEAPPTPPEVPKDIAQLTLTGRFATVDVTYGRAGQYIALDMKGDATSLVSSDGSFATGRIAVTKSTTYQLVYPEQGACDSPPELTIEKGALHLVLQRAGKPDGTISGCHFLAEFVKASDGGFQAVLKDVPIQGGGKIKQLSIDLQGPPS